jgi:hypothetical protein
VRRYQSRCKNKPAQRPALWKVGRRSSYEPERKRKFRRKRPSYIGVGSNYGEKNLESLLEHFSSTEKELQQGIEFRFRATASRGVSVAIGFGEPTIESRDPRTSRVATATLRGDPTKLEQGKSKSGSLGEPRDDSGRGFSARRKDACLEAGATETCTGKMPVPPKSPDAARVRFRGRFRRPNASNRGPRLRPGFAPGRARRGRHTNKPTLKKRGWGTRKSRSLCQKARLVMTPSKADARRTG